MLTPSETTNFKTLPKLEEFADDNFELTKMAKFSKRVENTVGKGEIAP